MSQPPATNPDAPRWHRAVESPWFYATSFSLFAAAILLAANHKYQQRQAGIERRFQARTQAATALADVADETATREVPKYSEPGQTVIPIWPLIVFALFVAAVSATMMIRAAVTRERPA